MAGEQLLIAAVAAAAPMLAVILAWNQQRAAVRRIEDNTNGRLLALQAQVDGLKRLRAVEMRQREREHNDPGLKPDDPQRDFT